jgi:uncharacterized tellurite resistance protein B-like protein
METISFDNLLLKTAFCCMAADGNIDEREISLLRSLCEKSSFFVDFNFQQEINLLIGKINNDGKTFIKYYFDLLEQTSLSEQEELTLIEFAIKTINADEQIEYSEIKFFKNIRHRLKVADEIILEHYPNIELYLEADIITDSYLDKITDQYFEVTDLPQFALVDITGIADDRQSNNE